MSQPDEQATAVSSPSTSSVNSVHPATTLRDISSQQWKSGIAAWLGWLFDGLDMHLYVLVATPFVAQLIHATTTSDPMVGKYSSIIQASFLVGWALGGAFFGRVGDMLGRSRALSLTVLTYALFTGLSFFAQTWWQLMIFRFLAALGIGGEWAVGASLLSETWPKKWRPWIAAILQTGVNVGVMLATLTLYLMAKQPERYVFLVGILPALLVFWIRKHVPEPEEWHAAKAKAKSAEREPGIADLFRGAVKSTTIKIILICSVTLTAHWAFLFWFQVQLRNHPDLQDWTSAHKNQFAGQAMFLVMLTSVAGNFIAAAIARRFGYPKSIGLLSFTYCIGLVVAYSVPRSHEQLMWIFPIIGISQGIFGLFTMYLPPLFPTLLRSTGAGFCYNIGRIVAAGGTIFFSFFSTVGDYRIALLTAGLLFIPAVVISFFLPELSSEEGGRS